MKRDRVTGEGVRVEVKGKNLAVTPALRDQVMGKMRKLDRYLDRLSTIEVELSTEKTKSASHHNCVEATSHVRGRPIRVHTVNADMYAAVDEAVDKLYRQLNRTKERMKSHAGTRFAEVTDVEEAESTVDVEESEHEIRLERVTLEPIFEDEAVGELESGDRPFYVFVNARNERISVLYRHADGSYGLIEPVLG